MNHIFDTEDEEQSSTQLKFLKTFIDKLIKGRKHPTGAPPSSRTTNFFCGERRTILKIPFLAMKKMKNSYPHVPHVPHVPQVRQWVNSAEGSEVCDLTVRPFHNPQRNPEPTVET
ncbi:MAG: hypothetical protein WBF13_09130 [Candidatus Zixiibacteriota bacterium]